MSNNEQYQKDYSEEGFWDKVTQYAKEAGIKLIDPALRMYYAAQDPDTPIWAKGVIYGALGYFISPLDVIPDLAPVVGYSDDLAVVAAALAAVAVNIKEEHIKQAQEKIKQWFG